MAIINLTNVFGIVNDLKTRLFFEEEYTLKFYNGNTLLLEVENGFYVGKDPIMDVTSPTYQEGYKEFYYCTIAALDETVDLNPIVKKTTHIRVGDGITGNNYTVEQYIRPTSTGTRLHRLRLSPSN